jgi:hypothetical protein
MRSCLMMFKQANDADATFFSVQCETSAITQNRPLIIT